MPPAVRVIFDAGQTLPWKLQRAVSDQWITTSRYGTRALAEKALARLVADMATYAQHPSEAK